MNSKTYFKFRRFLVKLLEILFQFLFQYWQSFYSLQFLEKNCWTIVDAGFIILLFVFSLLTANLMCLLWEDSMLFIRIRVEMYSGCYCTINENGIMIMRFQQICNFSILFAINMFQQQNHKCMNALFNYCKNKN